MLIVIINLALLVIINLALWVLIRVDELTCVNELTVISSTNCHVKYECVEICILNILLKMVYKN